MVICRLRSWCAAAQILASGASSYDFSGGLISARMCSVVLATSGLLLSLYTCFHTQTHTYDLGFLYDPGQFEGKMLQSARLKH